MSAGNTQICVNIGTPLLIALNGINPTVGKAGPYLMGNSIIRTDRLTFSAFNTLFLVDHRMAADHGYSSSRTDLPARMGNTTHTLVGYLIAVFRTRITGRWNHLHQWRFIIFFINITFFHPLRHMHRRIFRTERQAHRQSDLLPYNGPLPINTFVFRFIIINNLIRKRFHIILQIFRMISKICHLFKNPSSIFAYLSIDTSHLQYLSNKISLQVSRVYSYTNLQGNQGINQIVSVINKTDCQSDKQLQQPSTPQKSEKPQASK